MCDKKHYDDLESRVTALEGEVANLRSETRSGFATVNANIETLSQLVANMDRRIIEEKVKWGDVTRSMAKWTLRAILAIVVYAAGVNVTKTLLGCFFGG